MNIFYLADTIEESVTLHLDSHCGKIVTEVAQCLSTARHSYISSNLEIPSSIVWMEDTKDHPIIRWLKESPDNMHWAARYGLALRGEYIHRYKKSYNYLRECSIFAAILAFYPKDGEMTPFKCAIPDECKISDDPVECYRHYYNTHKRHLFYKKNGTPRWTNRQIPNWIKI